MSLGTLTIDLAANVARLQSDLGRANRLSQKYADDQRRRFQRIGRVIGTAIAGLATGAFAHFIKSSIDAADHASKTAKALGITIEAYQGLSFAASLGGVAQGEMTQSLTKFNKVISEAAAGTKKQAQAFADLGVALRDSSGKLKTADQLLLDVADRFARYEDGANKAALAQELFGRSGAKLIPMLNSGREGIEQLMQRAQKLGLIMSQESATAAENFNDKLTVLNGVARGAGNQIAAELLPTLDEMAGLLIDVAEDSGTAAIAADVLGGVLKGLATIALGVGSAFTAAGQGWGAFAAAAAAALDGEFAQALEIAKAGANDVADTYEKAFDRIEKLWSGDYAKAGKDAAATAGFVRLALERTTEEQQKANAATEKAVEAIEAKIAALELEAATLGLTSQEQTLYKLALDNATDAQLRRAKASLDSIAAYEAEQDALKAHAELVKEVTQVVEGSFSDASRALLDYQRKVEKLREGLLAGAITEGAYDNAVAGLDVQLEAAQDKANETGDALSLFADQAARNMQSAFADFLFDPFAQGLDGMLAGFGQMLQRMVAEAAAAQLMDEIFGAVGSGAGGEGRDGGLLAAGFNSLSGLFGGARAVGGPVEAGKLYEVGENNMAEMFVSNGRQYLIPGNSGSVKTGGAGNSTTQVFNIQTPDANSFRASQRQIARRAKQQMSY
jgi:hypothetical protein